MKKKYFTLGFILLLVLITSCQPEDPEPNPPAPLTNSTVTDIDGNVYSTQIIGTQEWMVENLRTSKYCNGDSIPNVINDIQWENLTTGAWSHYNNDSLNENPYGKLYNWFAVVDARNICPCGWHVPSDEEWTELTDYLGSDAISGGKMKSTDTLYWQSPNMDATNESGFSGLPGGTRSSNGYFGSIGTGGYWWSSTEYLPSVGWRRSLGYNGGNTMTGGHAKGNGLSVRCLKD